MIIETERLIIRQYTEGDFGGLYAMLSDAETMCHYPKPYDEKGARAWLDWCLKSYAENGFGLWALESKATGEFLGDCGISMQKIDGVWLPEIGYHLHKRFWRQGIGKEAAGAVRDWAFNYTWFDTLYSYMTVSNVASYSTAASIGMRRIKQYTDDSGEELYVYAITREEWQGLK